MLAAHQMGIIYAIPPGGQPTVLAHTGSHYVWDLALDNQGRLHAATGEPASVLRVAADGAIETLFKPTDRHLMTMLFADGALYAGSAQKGRIYHVDGDRGRLLFEAVEEEINGLMRDDAGALYASAIGHGDGDENGSSPSTVYRIAPDGAAQRWWSDDHVLLRDIAPADGGLLVATDGGRVLHLDAQGRPGLRTQDENFRTGRMLQTADGAVYLADAHSGQLKRLGTASAKATTNRELTTLLAIRDGGASLGAAAASSWQRAAATAPSRTPRGAPGLLRIERADRSSKVRPRATCSAALSWRETMPTSSISRCTDCAPICRRKSLRWKSNPIAHRREAAINSSSRQRSSSAAEAHAGAQPLSPALAGQ